jgi:hypothetical protein
MTFSKILGCFSYSNWDLEPVQFEIKFQVCKKFELFCILGSKLKVNWNGRLWNQYLELVKIETQF